MLGSLARKLRLYGLDVLYTAHTQDSYLLTEVISEDRILLTADNQLHEQATRRGARSILLKDKTDQDRLVSLFRVLAVKPSAIAPGSSRCPSCNGELVLTSRLKIHDQLPSRVSQNHRTFYRCVSCGKLFWEGSHWKRISLMSKYVLSKLAEENRKMDEL